MSPPPPLLILFLQFATISDETWVIFPRVQTNAHDMSTGDQGWIIQFSSTKVCPLLPPTLPPLLCNYRCQAMSRTFPGVLQIAESDYDRKYEAGPSGLQDGMNPPQPSFKSCPSLSIHPPNSFANWDGISVSYFDSIYGAEMPLE